MAYSKRHGFTLVELAIVITIIGLLIGGVLKGQELLENSRMTATANQVQGYKAALTTFQSIYKALPGDLRDAQNFLPNCTSGNQCTNGNNDGKVNPGTDYYNLSGASVIGSESVSFWKHLSLANLVNGIDPTATTLAAGRTHPIVPIGGVFHAVSFNAVVLDYAPFSGTVVSLKKTTNGTWNGADAVTVSTAMKLDLKMDDGQAVKGDVQSVSNAWTNGCGNATNGPTGYNIQITGVVCEMVFNLQ